MLLILYLSWLPTPRLATSGMLPVWITAWTDDSTHDNIRTGIPFLFLGLLSGIWLTLQGGTWRLALTTWLVWVGLALIAETGQLFLPKRSFDLGDILWAAGGAFIGQLAIKLMALFRKPGRPY